MKSKIMKYLSKHFNDICNWSEEIYEYLLLLMNVELHVIKLRLRYAFLCKYSTKMI